MKIPVQEPILMHPVETEKIFFAKTIDNRQKKC